MPLIDIHPHIVSPDTKKYPLDPLGGTQSTWSRDRPTPYEALVVAMDQAGVVAGAAILSLSSAQVLRTSAVISVQFSIWRKMRLASSR